MTRFQDDLDFLAQFVDVICLQNREGATSAIVPQWQGRIVTSATSSDSPGFGWINRKLIETQHEHPQANLYGGEDRAWIAPEGGQFSFYFPPGHPFRFEHWRCPALIDTLPFSLTEVNDHHVHCTGRSRVQNHSGHWFEMELHRTLILLEREEVASALGVSLNNSLRLVAHESRTTLANVGDLPWTHATGLPALWILGMFQPSDAAVMIVPFRPGPEQELGPVVTTDYFGPLDESRLRIDQRHHVILFRGDGKYRSKIGVAYPRARSRLGSWDPQRGVLTLVEFSLPTTDLGYTNNLWKWQEHPWRGDVVNAYNDGPQADAEPLGPFYELETLSPALALAPLEHYEHRHRTIHLVGDVEALRSIARQCLGVDLSTVAFDSAAE